MSRRNEKTKYTKEFKSNVIKERLDGMTLNELSKKYMIPTSTIAAWERKLKQQNFNELSMTKENDSIVDDIYINQNVEALNQKINLLETELHEKNNKIINLNERTKIYDIDYDNPEQYNIEIKRLQEENKNKANKIELLYNEANQLNENIEKLKKEIIILKEAFIIMNKNYEK